MERHPCKGSFQKIQDVVGRGGKHGRRLKSGSSSTDERFQPSNAGNDSIKKINKHFQIYNYPHWCFSSKPYKRRDFHLTWKAKGGSKHLRVGDGNKVIIIILFWYPPTPTPHPPASFSWLLAFYSPISGWEYMTGWMVRFPAKPQHRKRDLSCPGLPTLLCPFQTDACACTCASRRISTCKPGLSSSVELSANYKITNVGRHRTSTQPRMKWLQALFFSSFF